MTLDEAKAKALSIYQTNLCMMRDWIEEPETLKHCGYRTLEDALTKTVLHALKQADKVFKEYERDNPDD